MTTYKCVVCGNDLSPNWNGENRRCRACAVDYLLSLSADDDPYGIKNSIAQGAFDYDDHGDSSPAASDEIDDTDYSDDD